LQSLALLFMKFIKRISTLIIILVCLIVVLDVTAILVFAHWRPEIKKADAIIILGAAINTPALHNRTLEGLHLYEQGKADVIVLSGGKIADEDISEAQYMKKVIERETDQTPPLILEDQSHSTDENLTNSQKLLGDQKSVIIVSDEFHLGRAVLLAMRRGFHPVAWSAPKPDYYSNRDLRYYYLREFLAVINYLPKLIKG
jgi:uncharacterized SAM-binding protein YcdF (DUF218 family)